MLVAELDADGQVRAEYVWGSLGPVARIAGGRVQLYVCDALGHVRALIDAETGQITDRYDYDAWGNVVHNGSTRQPFVWNGAYGYEWVPGVSLYHVGARAYEPRTARWLQRDLIDAASGDPNLYRYCLANPVMYKDPDGLKAAVASECNPCRGIPSGLVGFGAGLEYALYRYNRPTQHGFARLGYYAPGQPQTRRNFMRTFHWDYDPTKGTHFNAEAGPLKIFDSHRRFPRGVPIKGLPHALRHLGHTRVLRCVARGSLGLGLALDAIDIATAKPCNRGRAVGRAVGGIAGAALGAAIGSSIAPGAGTFIGGAIGGFFGGIIGDRIGALFDPPCEEANQ